MPVKVYELKYARCILLGFHMSATAKTVDASQRETNFIYAKNAEAVNHAR